MEYINAAMLHAQYDKLANGGWLGFIPEFDALYIIDETLGRAQESLQNALENWLIASHDNGLALPVIDGLDLSAAWEGGSGHSFPTDDGDISLRYNG